jgi:dynein heavy chain, axonemal
MQVTAASAMSAINIDEHVHNIATDIEAKLPTPFDVLALRKEAGLDVSPSKVVLFQELERFNRLIFKMADSLFNLKRALKGEIGMSGELDELSISLFNAFLPGIQLVFFFFIIFY